MAYDFLSDMLVLEVSQFGPDALGGYLADMGARVIKVEPPVTGDALRYAGAQSVGDPHGFSYLHLRWNRGKQSLVCDITTPEGAEDFRKLAAKADIVYEGMRAGVLERYGLGYEALKKINPRIVFCSLSGMGRDGPYAKMASHGPSFDAFAGLTAPQGDVISKYEGAQPASIGMYAYGLQAAFAVCAGVLRARRTGEGALIEVAAAECAAHWLPESLDPLLNADITYERPGFNDADGRMRLWARMENYKCRDGKVIYLMTLTDKSWKALLKVTGRQDLEAIYKRQPQTGHEDREVQAELIKIFATRDRADWLVDFARENVAAMPQNTPQDTVNDPHFKARANVYQVALPSGQILHLTSTPMRVEGQEFATTLAPLLGEHDDLIRTEFSLGPSQA